MRIENSWHFIQIQYRKESQKLFLNVAFLLTYTSSPAVIAGETFNVNSDASKPSPKVIILSSYSSNTIFFLFTIVSIVENFPYLSFALPPHTTYLRHHYLNMIREYFAVTSTESYPICQIISTPSCQDDEYYYHYRATLTPPPIRPVNILHYLDEQRIDRFLSKCWNVTRIAHVKVFALQVPQSSSHD